MSKAVEQRRICWPDFDATCLEGGCHYCNGNRFRNVSSIEQAVKAGKGHARNRGNGTAADLEWSLRYGRRHNWHNAESRMYERGRR